MTRAAPFACEPLRPATVAALSELFTRAESGCFCAYWHFSGDKNDWQARLAFAPEDNRRELALRAERPLTGLLAKRADGAVIGWMKLEPAAEVAKIYEQRPYRALPILRREREHVWTVGCFLVDPTERRRGVARALLDAGIALAREHGARALEAFPRRADGLRDEELWTGPADLFLDAGFRIVHEQIQYPVLRYDL